MFVYKCYRIKVKVTGAKNIENPYSRSALTGWLGHLTYLTRINKPVTAYSTSLHTRIRGWSALD